MLSTIYKMIRSACPAAPGVVKMGPLVVMEGPIIVAVVAVFLCALMPLELSQLLSMVIGAVAYALLQGLQPSTRQAKGAKKAKAQSRSPPRNVSSRSTPACLGPRGKGGDFGLPVHALQGAQQGAAGAPGPGRVEMRTPSSSPVAAPTFALHGWEAEVKELISQITPTSESDRIVQRLAALVRTTVRRTIPEAEVLAFVSGDLARGKAFGVAVPDVDIVINVDPTILVSRLQGRLSQGRTTVMNLDSRRLQKSAIRVCTDKLVTQGGFKFRRSAFRGQEPKVTLLAPASLGIFDHAVPVDFTINSLTPLYNAALFTECGRMDARAGSLILLVKRWAKDRGICHAAKGHLPPYLWSLLTIYFLQVGAKDEEPILPPLEAFEVSSSLMMQSAGSAAGCGLAAAAQRPNSRSPEELKQQEQRALSLPVGELFKGFIAFYSRHFDWRNEAVSIRLGRRSAPGLRLPLHIVLHDDGISTEVGPSIEDPFDSSNNLGACMTAVSIVRLREELRRADNLCCGQASLTQLLEPWIPPEHELADSGEAA